MDFTKHYQRYNLDPKARMSSSNKKMKHVRLEKQYIAQEQQIENGQKQNINSNFNKEAIQLLFMKSELQLKNKNLLKYQTEKLQQQHFNNHFCLNSQEKQNHIDSYGKDQKKQENYSRKQENRDQHRPEISSIPIVSRIIYKEKVSTNSSIESYLQLNVTLALEKIRKYMSEINQAIELISQDVKVIKQKSQFQLNNKLKKMNKIRRLLNIVHKFVVDKNLTVNDTKINICDNQCESQVISPQLSQGFYHNKLCYMQKLPHEQILSTIKKIKLEQSSQAIKNHQQILEDQTQIQNQNCFENEQLQATYGDYQSKMRQFEINHFSPKIYTIYQPLQTMNSIQIFDKYDFRSPQYNANEQTKKESETTNLLYEKPSNMQYFDKKQKLSILSNVVNYHGVVGQKDQFSIPNIESYNRILQYQQFEEKVVKRSTVLSTKSLNLCIHALNLAFFLFKNCCSCLKRSCLQQNQLRTNSMYFHDDIRGKSRKRQIHKQKSSEISHLKINSISKKQNKQNTYSKQKHPSTCQTSKETLQIRQTLVIIKNKIRNIARQSQCEDRKSQTKRKLFDTNQKSEQLRQVKKLTDNSIKFIKKRDQKTLTTLIELYEEAKSVFKKLQERHNLLKHRVN